MCPALTVVMIAQNGMPGNLNITGALPQAGRFSALPTHPDCSASYAGWHVANQLYKLQFLSDYRQRECVRGPMCAVQTWFW